MNAPPRRGPATPPAVPQGPTFLERVKLAPVTFALAAINIAFYAYVASHQSDFLATPSISTLLRFGAVERYHVWAGEYWRLASNMFLHIGWIHLLWNTYASIGFCMAVERAFGHRRFLVVYLLAGVGGGIAVVLSPRFSVAAGASGALFGIVASMLVLLYRRAGSIRAFANDPNARSILKSIGLWTVVMIAISLNGGPNVSHEAHLGGFVIGGLATYALTARRRAALAVLAAAFVALVVFAIRPWGRAEAPQLHEILQEDDDTK